MKNALRNNKWIIITVVLFPFVSIYFFTQLLNFSVFGLFDFSLDKLGIIFTFEYTYLFYCVKKKKPSLLLMGTYLLVLWISICKFKVDGFHIRAYGPLLYLIGIGTIIEYYIDQPKELIKACMLNFELSIYPVFCRYIYNIAVGISSKWRLNYLGVSNCVGMYCICAICISFFYYIIVNKSKRPIVLSTVSVISAFISEQATPICAMATLIGLLMFQYIIYKKIGKKHIKVMPYYIATIVFGIFIIYVHREGLIPIFDFFITKVLKKSITFTHRDGIWKDATRIIINHPLFGNHGIRDAGGYYHAHNEYLNFGVESGILGIILFIIINYIFIKNLEIEKNIVIKIMFVAIFISINMTYIVDAYLNGFVFAFAYFLMYNFDKIKTN